MRGEFFIRKIPAEFVKQGCFPSCLTGRFYGVWRHCLNNVALLVGCVRIENRPLVHPRMFLSQVSKSTVFC